MNKAIKNQETIGNWVFPVKIGCNYSTFGVTLDGRNFHKQSCDTLTVIDTIASVDNTWSTASVEGWEALDVSNTVARISGELRSTRTGAGVLGMYKLTNLEHADYIIVKARMRRNTATGTAYGRLRLVDTTTNTVVWKDSVVVGTTNVNYSSSIGIIPAGVYRFELERRNNAATQFFIDNVLQAYVDTSSVVDCEGGKKDYVYAFNSQEKIDELSGEGNAYDFGARMYNPRLGRWLTIDSEYKRQPGWSSYKAMNNNPIVFADPDGNVEIIKVVITDEKTGSQVVLTYEESDKLMTDGNKYMRKTIGSCYVNYNAFYDYETVITINVKPDGSTSKTINTNILKENGVKLTDDIWFSGYDEGATIDPDDPEPGTEYAFGIEFTSTSGGQTEHNNTARNTVTVSWDDISALMGILQKDPKYKPNQFGVDWKKLRFKNEKNIDKKWKEIMKLAKALSKGGDQINKIIKAFKDAKKELQHGKNNGVGETNTALKQVEKSVEESKDSVEVTVEMPGGKSRKYKVDADSAKAKNGYPYPNNKNSKEVKTSNR